MRIQHYSDSPTLLPLMMPRPPAPAVLWFSLIIIWVVHLSERTQTGLITASDQAVRAAHSCNSKQLGLLAWDRLDVNIINLRNGLPFCIQIEFLSKSSTCFEYSQIIDTLLLFLFNPNQWHHVFLKQSCWFIPYQIVYISFPTRSHDA